MGALFPTQGAFRKEIRPQRLQRVALDAVWGRKLKQQETRCGGGGGGGGVKVAMQTVAHESPR